MSAALLLMWCGIAASAQQAPLKVAIGNSHGLLLKTDGSVWAWGSNACGQLGTDDDFAATPVRVPGLSAVRDIAAGDCFSAAVGSDGSLWTWGGNQYGELGNGTKEASAKPTPVAGLSGVAAVAAAGEHILVLKSDGTVWAWGENPNEREWLLPKQVENLQGVVAVAASARHSVALKSDGTVWVWGDHGLGDLGDGCYNGSTAPQQVPALSGVTAIAAGQELTVALKKDGTVWTMGYGTAGQLGNGSKENFSLKPVIVTGLRDVRVVAAGTMHVVALKADGTVWSWGYNHSHQLGNSSKQEEEYAVPVRTGTLNGVAFIAAASNHSAAVTSRGTVWAWGENNGVLGVDPEDTWKVDVPMKVGAAVQGDCWALFACQTARGKVIRICGDRDDNDSDKWHNIQYRYGPESGPAELVYPLDPGKSPPLMLFSEDDWHGDYRVTVRFTSGAFTYRVYSGSKSGAGVEVIDGTGKTLANIQCAEAPAVYIEYLKMNLPCDPQSPHAAVLCPKSPYNKGK